MGIDCKIYQGIHVWEDHYIRHRIRDFTSVLSREKCECGRTCLRIDRLKGRTDDMLKVKGVNFYPGQIEAILMGHKEVGPEYQIILERKKAKTEVRVVLEVKPGVESKELRAHLATHLYDFLGFRVDVELVPEGTIPRKPGKAQRVVDKRKAE